MKNTAYALANIMAMLGGLVLVAIILMTVISVIGRALIPIGLGPITGDFELTELGIAFAIFCFLPLCQLVAGHATVDVFTSGMGARANLVLLALWEVVLTATMIFIAWRLFAGFSGKLGNNETTMLLRVPVWWGYGAALVPAGVGVLVGLWSAYDRVMAALTGKVSRTIEGASH
ncbi:MAG: TRAP transporter small permease [Cypionkella sp.]|nr:TRAP transporter small permease [Cypionkella sp.]